MGAEAARRQPRGHMPPTTAPPRSPGHGVDESESRRELDLIIAEFTSLRNEIDMRNTSQTQILNFAVLLFAGTTAAVFAAFNSGSFEKARLFVVFVLLVSSALFTTLVYTFTEQEYETMFVASYVERRLRIRASQLLRREPDETTEVLRILDWEAFRRGKFRGPPENGESARHRLQGERREESWRRRVVRWVVSWVGRTLRSLARLQLVQRLFNCFNRVVRRVGCALRFLVFVPSYYGRSMLMLIPSVLCLVFSLVLFLVGPPGGRVFVGFILFFLVDLIYAGAAFSFAHFIRHAHGHRIQPIQPR